MHNIDFRVNPSYPQMMDEKIQEKRTREEEKEKEIEKKIIIKNTKRKK